MYKEVLTYIHQHQANYLEDLKTFLAMPSISTQSQHRADMQRSATWLADKMKSIGLQNVTIYPTAGHPVVYSEWLEAGPEAPTVLIYGHYDVQPVDPLDEWETPPFEPTVRGEDIFARGATDDKGQLLIHVAAAEAMLKATGKLPLNVKFLIEGEEEIGSVHLNTFIEEHLDLLRADCAIISDTPFAAPGKPTIVYGLRGLTGFEVTVKSVPRDLHSGMYGGVVRNPLNELAKIIAALHDDDGKITIPGLYDDVLPLTPEEQDLLAQLPDDYLNETGARQLWGETGFNPRERVGARPSLDVHGIIGGYTGEGQKTVLPAKATAKISIRLVANQDPHKVNKRFTDYIQHLASDTVEVSVSVHNNSYPALVNREDPSMVAATKAYKLGFDAEPSFAREGGTLPVVVSFQQCLNLPVVLMGFGLPDDNLHAPNEKFHLPNFYKGVETSVHFMYAYAELKDK